MTPNIVKGSNSLPADRYDHPNHPQNNPDFQPESLKQKAEQQQDVTSQTDADHSANAMDARANKATQNSDPVEGIYENSKQKLSAGDKETGHGTSVFDAKQGAIGSVFHKDGTLGQIGEKIGGPLASDGAIGKNFNPDGAIGGTFQKLADRNQDH